MNDFDFYQPIFDRIGFSPIHERDFYPRLGNKKKYYRRRKRLCHR